MNKQQQYLPTLPWTATTDNQSPICCDNPSIIYDTDDYVCRNCGTCHQYMAHDTYHNDHKIYNRYIHTDRRGALVRKHFIFERRPGRITFQSAYCLKHAAGAYPGSCRYFPVPSLLQGSRVEILKDKHSAVGSIQGPLCQRAC